MALTVDVDEGLNDGDYKDYDDYYESEITRNWWVPLRVVRFPNPLAPGSDIQIHVSWGTLLGKTKHPKNLKF